MVLLLLAALLLAACGGAATPAPAPAAHASPAGGRSAQRPRACAPSPSCLRESKASYIVDEEFFADAREKYNIEAGQVKTVGSTQEIAGQLQLNLEDLTAPLGDNRFTVQINTLESDQALRDRWIAQQRPQAERLPHG